MRHGTLLKYATNDTRKEKISSGNFSTTIKCFKFFPNNYNSKNLEFKCKQQKNRFSHLSITLMRRHDIEYREHVHD